MHFKDSPEIERRFLLRSLPSLSGFTVNSSHIEQTYLALREAGPQETHRLRKRSDSSGSKFYYTVKSPRPDGSRNEREQEITAEAYAAKLQFADPARRCIVKTRKVFECNGRTLELDLFENELQGLVILEVELPSFETPLELPENVAVLAEVTLDPWFSNSSLAGADVGEIWRRVRALSAATASPSE